jgi:hypothetical protein
MKCAVIVVGAVAAAPVIVTHAVSYHGAVVGANAVAAAALRAGLELAQISRPFVVARAGAIVATTTIVAVVEAL